MKYSDVLVSHEQANKDLIHSNITNLGDNLFGKGYWSFIYGYTSSTEVTIKGSYIGTEIGNSSLIDNSVPDKYNKAGYVYVIKDIFHEYKHVHQYTKEWNKPRNINIETDNDKIMTDIVRRKLISLCYPSAYINNYINDPGEMDAEVYAIEQSLEYFKSDPIIKESEAREILYEFMTSEDYYNKAIFDGHEINSIDDVLNILKEHKTTCVNILYEITDNIPAEFEDDLNKQGDMTEDFLYSPKFESYRKALNICVTGIEQDKVLEQTLFIKYPHINDYVERLSQELLDCKAQVQEKKTKAYLTHSEDSAILPHEISYMKSSVIKEFTDGIQSISENSNTINLSNG